MSHQRGILHRDLKPANILVDERGEPFVTDFGLAKRFEVDSKWTVSGAILGTPAYMSPEQTSGKRGAMTTATDVYGIGAVLYALLAGRAPFGGDSIAETLAEVRDRAPEPPTKRNRHVPRDLEVICLKCLEKDPSRRYGSAQSLGDDLSRFLNKEPILARPVSVLTRAWLWCKRKPALAGLVAGLITAVVFGITGLTWYWNEASRRNESELQGRMAVDLLSKIPQIGFDDSVDALKKELLESVLAYYERSTDHTARDLAILLNDGRTYQKMGDIQRKLGAFHNRSTPI